MTITWSEIDKALNELVKYEEGFRFERLAIGLAKQKGLGIVATEIHKDGGEDAFTHPFFTKDGKRIRIASSITAKWDKIKDDLKSIYGRGIILDLLIFYTPHKVSNRPTVDDWKRKTKSQFGCELIVISREDIIQDLLDPKNHWLCSTYLGIQIPISATVKGEIEKTAKAAYKVLEQWKRRYRFNPDHLIDLTIMRLDEKLNLTREISNKHETYDYLSNAGRAVLYGSPGAGKTTKLIQIAEHFLETEQKKVPLLISLPDWIESEKNIIDFVLEHPDFLAIGITPTDLASLHRSNHLIFILNGWNEIPTNLMDRAGRRLSQIERDYPTAGIIISTRASDIRPPLYGAIELKLTPITEDQRRIYIKSVLSDSGEELIIQIESDPVLSEITTTPLILSEITKIYKSGERVPNTKTGVLWTVIHSMEESEEHRIQILSAPIYGRASKYLSEISAIMAQEKRTLLHSEKANEVITSVNKKLMSEGQLATLHDPKQIVDGLCAHHILVKSNYPFSSVHFLHQQFQELYATNNIKETLIILTKFQDKESIKHFQKNILDEPAWGESLKLLAEEIGEEIKGNGNSRFDEIDTLKLGTNLVKWCIPVDPIFSAELARICGSDVWEATKKTLEPIFRKWYDLPNEIHKSCSLAGMFATGADNFSDIIWPLIKNTDQQIRLKTYRDPVTFFISCLGPDWRKRVNSWDEKRREEFINELGFKGGLDSHTVLEEFANNDPSIEVRTSAISAFRWRGLFNKFLQMLHHCNDETFKNIVRKDYIPRNIPESLRSRLEETYPKLLSESNDEYWRILFLTRLSRVENLDIIDAIKVELERYSFEDHKQNWDHLLIEAIRIVSAEDPDWTCKWVSKKWSEGKIWGESWIEFLNDIPNTIYNEIFERFVVPNYDDNVRKDQMLILKGVTKKHTLIILNKLIELEKHIDNSKERPAKPQRELYYDLLDTARELPIDILVQNIIDSFSEPSNISELHLILEVLRRGRIDKNDKEKKLNEEIVLRIRKVLHKYADIVLAQEDYNGELKGYLSSALGRFGDINDLHLIEKLIYADIKRFNTGLEAFKKREKLTERVQGFRHSWCHWHIDALIKIDPEEAGKILLGLLKEPYYERDAAEGLVRILSYDKEDTFDWHFDYIDHIKKREKREKPININKDKKIFETAIKNQIERLLRERDKSEKPNEYTYRIKTLGAILAKIGEVSSVSTILEIMALEGEYDLWTRVEALESLITQGNVIDIEIVDKIIDPVIDQLIERGMRADQNYGLLERCCVIFVFSNNLIGAINKIKELIPKHLPVHKMSRLIKALGNIDSLEAIKYLLELAQNPQISKRYQREIIKVLANSHFKESNNALMSTIDQEITDLKILFPDDYFGIQMLSQSIADLCKKDKNMENRIFELCNSNLSPKQHELILNVIKHISTTQAIKAGLNMMQENIPYPLLDVIENAFIERIPSTQFASSYTLESRKNDAIRSYLFDMVLDDEKRSNSAFSLLSHITQWRLEHGKPSDESRHPNIKRGVPWPPLDQII